VSAPRPHPREDVRVAEEELEEPLRRLADGVEATAFVWSCGGGAAPLHHLFDVRWGVGADADREVVVPAQHRVLEDSEACDRRKT